RFALAPGVPIERRDEEESSAESESIENHHAVDLNGGGETRRGFLGAHEGSKQGSVEKLQRIDAEKDETKKSNVKKNGPAGAEAVAAKKDVMRIPDVDQHQKTDGGSGESGSGRTQVAEASRNGERDHEENESDAENDIAEHVETSDGIAAETEVVIGRRKRFHFSGRDDQNSQQRATGRARSPDVTWRPERPRSRPK